MKRALVSAVVLSVTFSGAAQALTLREAAQLALRHDPRMLATHAAVGASEAVTDEAAAGYRPSIGVAADVGRSNLWTGAPFPVSGPRWPNTASLNASQPLYSGGATSARVEAAAASLASTRESQRDTGGRIILAALTAYLDVQRDRSVVALSESSVRTLEQASADTVKRAEAGEATHTDEAQARARLAEARAGLKRANAQLRVSEASFERVTGVAPVGLAPGWPLPAVPASLQESIALAERAPAVLAAQASAQAARSQIRVTGAEGRPQVSLDGRLYTQDNTEFGYDRLNEWIVQLKLSMPLYEGGLISARVAEAQARADQAGQMAEDMRNVFVEGATQEWEMLQAADEVILSYQAQQQAAEMALDGTRKELEVGTRTTLDLLNAERELLAAQVSLVGSQRDRAVAAFRLMAACGKLEPQAIP